MSYLKFSLLLSRDRHPLLIRGRFRLLSPKIAVWEVHHQRFLRYVTFLKKYQNSAIDTM